MSEPDEVTSLSVYQNAFRTFPAACLLLSTDIDAVVLAVTDAFAQAFSIQASQIVGAGLFKLPQLAPADRASTREALRHSISLATASGRPNRVVVAASQLSWPAEVAAQNNETHDWSVEHAPVHDQCGELVCIRQTFTVSPEVPNTAPDATLPDSERRYQTLLEQTTQGFCIIEMLFDGDGRAADYRFLTVNPAFEANTGLVDATGRTMLELVPEHERHWFDAYAQVARTGIPVHFQNEAAALKRWYDVHAFRLDASQPNQVAILFSDITEQRDAQLRLARSERSARAAALLAEAATRRLDALLEVAPVGIVVSDRHGAIERENRTFAQLWGEHHPDRTQLDDLGKWKARWADTPSDMDSF
ncbi:PAS domain-containing protein [Caballeronia sp. Lep1P3]|uniref:PAS domain-containing protein n=1 Tax=Caballeronia sp. Lep1P3 TaxID=2878150 RepID=UPI001FCFB29B|nr:PAS domain-containing protein [Caballeronia sp. Lep1P3]